MKGDKKSNKNLQGQQPLQKRSAPSLPEPEEDDYIQEEDMLEENGEEQEDFEEGEEELDGLDDYDDMEEEPEEGEGDELNGDFDDENPDEESPELDLERNIMEADSGLLNMKIQEILQRLTELKGQGPHTESRVPLLIELKKLFCKYFSYNMELMEYIMQLFNPAECLAFLEMMDTPRPVTIRINSIKTQRAGLVKALTEKTVAMEPVDEVSKMAFKINSSKVPIGATPEYLAGHYMLQSAASMLAVRALAPQPGEKVLDMASAPGGKTTYIGQLMKNKGTIVANDMKTERTKALFYNCQRMGLTNVIITNFDGRKFPSCMKFDRVLLDAPCTGLGVISRDPSIKAKRNMMDVYKAAHLQRELLRKAIDLCKVGGYVVYSTCSFAVEENEAVVDYACKSRYVKIVDTGLELENKAVTKYKDSHYNDRMKYCIRVLPHVHNMDGFFVAKLLKVKDGERKKESTEVQKSKKSKKHHKEAEQAQEVQEEQTDAKAQSSHSQKVNGHKNGVTKKVKAHNIDVEHEAEPKEKRLTKESKLKQPNNTPIKERPLKKQKLN
jgi:ribosomal RNA methyltransferase Nop2